LAKAAFDELGKVAGDSLLGILAAALARQMAARALLCEQVGQAWEHALSGDELPRQMIAHLRLAAVHAARTAAEECRVLQDSAGGAGVPVFSPLGRRLRDAQTVTAHALVSPRLHQELGKLIFGVPPGSTQR
jgi:alkylation response protein AidB-like acyl-CoA dehydrogenase